MYQRVHEVQAAARQYNANDGTEPALRLTTVSAQDIAARLLARLEFAHEILERTVPANALMGGAKAPTPVMGLLMLLERADKEVDALVDRLNNLCGQVGLL